MGESRPNETKHPLTEEEMVEILRRKGYTVTPPGAKRLPSSSAILDAGDEPEVCPCGGLATYCPEHRPNLGNAMRRQR